MATNALINRNRLSPIFPRRNAVKISSFHFGMEWLQNENVLRFVTYTRGLGLGNFDGG